MPRTIEPIELLVPDNTSAGVDAEASDEVVAQYGRKAGRLLRLPAPWYPTFTAVPISVYELWRKSRKSAREHILEAIAITIELWARTRQQDFQSSVILRSSAVEETLLDRGSYLSIVFDGNVNKYSLVKAITIFTHNSQKCPVRGALD